MKNSEGFSLVEIIIATVVLAIGMLAMAASTGYVAAEVRNATLNTQRAAAREFIVEELRATPFDSIATNATGRIVGRYSLTWTVLQTGPHIRRVSVIATGPAYRLGRGAISVATDTFIVNMVRP